ncbi:uncharacterized protein TRAVEDRAFT_123861 [Trametes versicolor FP-101664 SS1]|uniref:uncharacterized protein n=1 Tax=Trametes versicolor (strain FP-101664) TaxID=717944 RepID=UPI0004622B16|nr:uncharacterized protein TRAVEDRAFT_123861 [Trametes versicolor FP-101664 SS1]EIW58218.1 hypothetical protein TRAVEDRAFT_123861 [Trametes versicolor FP-101664 SS1]
MSDAPARVSPPLDPNGSSGALLDTEPDAQILEALRGKDRIYVLKLGEQMEALIKDRRVRIDLTPSTSYQRLLVHRCSAYYRLSPEADAATKNIIVYYRTESRIPPRRICELIPAEESAQPTIQIMRRPRGRQYSQPGSTAGEDADTSDVDASEAGSIGSRGHVPGAAGKRFKTIEEREAAYNEARSRIFMGFEDKDKEKEKDMSANSSTFSLVSGSGSTSGGRGSSIGDLDDSASSVPTESEWSGPVTRDKRDSRKGAGSTTSSRSIRSSGPSFTNGSSSSRNSRATSPSFTYPTLYDPATAPPFDQSQYGSMPPPAGYVSPYGYPTYTPGQPFMGPYYYPPYSYPQPPTHHSEPATPGGVEPMYPQPTPSQQPAYTPPYVWSNPPPAGQPPIHPQHLHHGQPGAVPTHPDVHSQAHPMPPMQNVSQYPPYTPSPPVYGYGMPAYYPQPYQQGVPMAPPPSIPGPVYHHNPVPEPMGANGNHSNGIDFSRTSSRNSNGHGSMNSKRGGARGRGSWSYGPGVSTSGYTFNSPSAMNGIGGNDAYGPRLSSNVRRASGTSSSGGSAGARTPADETASTASSSTTSSSSRRTFTSTSTSSKHPLPARPDWAVGLKPQHPRHHDSSPARMGSTHLPQPHQSQPVLQPNDFPPLSSGPSNRQPVVGGAWTNASTSRVMMPGPQGTVPQGTALVHYPASQQSSPQIPASSGRFDEQDLSFERPLSKNADLFNPKGGLRSAGGGVPSNGRAKGQGEGGLAGLSDKLGALGMEDCESRSAEVAGQDSYFPSVVAGEVAGGVPAGEPAAASS